MHNLMMIVFYGTTGDSEQGADITSRSDRKKRKEPVGKERGSHSNKNKIIRFKNSPGEHKYLIKTLT